MPILNSLGALREQSSIFSVTPISDTQWIVEFDDPTLTGSNSSAIPSINGNVYIFTPPGGGPAGLFKVNSAGSLLSQFNLSAGVGSVFAIDKLENVYAGGAVDAGIYVAAPNIIKYNKFNNILWQKYLDLGSSRTILSIQITASNDLFVLMGSEGGDPSLGNGPYVLLKINPLTGAIINQREVLKYTSSAPSDLFIDEVNQQLLVCGTDYQTTSEILIGTYDYTNTDTASNVVYQSSGTDDYLTTNLNAFSQNIVADDTYIYQVAYYVISGITRSVYLKIDRSTGAVSYGNRMTVGGSALTLAGISQDESGNFYITGATATAAGYTFIMQIDKSTGNINWIKQLGSGTGSDSIGPPTWSRGFIYFRATAGVGANVYSAIIKLKDDGSVADGTYGSHWIFATPTPTLISLTPDNTGTTTDSTNTTSYTASNTSLTKTSSALTITTYSL